MFGTNEPGDTADVPATLNKADNTGTGGEMDGVGESQTRGLMFSGGGMAAWLPHQPFTHQQDTYSFPKQIPRLIETDRVEIGGAA